MPASAFGNRPSEQVYLSCPLCVGVSKSRMTLPAWRRTEAGLGRLSIVASSDPPFLRDEQAKSSSGQPATRPCMYMYMYVYIIYVCVYICIYTHTYIMFLVLQGLSAPLGFLRQSLLEACAQCSHPWSQFLLLQRRGRFVALHSRLPPQLLMKEYASNLNLGCLAGQMCKPS